MVPSTNDESRQQPGHAEISGMMQSGPNDHMHNPMTRLAGKASSSQAGLNLQQPGAPVFVHQQVEAKQLEAVGQAEKVQLPTHRLQTLPCSMTQL